VLRLEHLDIMEIVRDVKALVVVQIFIIHIFPKYTIVFWERSREMSKQIDDIINDLYEGNSIVEDEQNLIKSALKLQELVIRGTKQKDFDDVWMEHAGWVQDSTEYREQCIHLLDEVKRQMIKKVNGVGK